MKAKVSTNIITTIIAKELRVTFRSGVILLAVGITACLLAVSLVVGTRYQATVAALHQTAEREAREHWDTQGKKNSHSAAHYGIYLFKPKSALALWDNGVDKFCGVSLYVEAHKRNEAEFKPIQDSPMLGKWGEFSPSFIALVLLPLVMVWLGFDMVASERERGTLRLVLAQGVSPLQLIVGKALALWMVALLLLLPSLAVTAFVAHNAAESFLGQRLLGLALVYALYIGIFIHCSLALSVLVKHTKTAFALLLMLWLSSTWIVPKLAGNAVESVLPSPTERAFRESIAADIKTNGIDGHNPKDKRAAQIREEIFARYGVTREKDLPINFLAVMMQASEENNDLIFDRHFDSLYTLYGKQTFALNAASVLSPFILARSLSMGFAGTDVWTHFHFTEAVDDYRRRFIKILNNTLRDNSRTGGRDAQTSIFWKTLPQFQYQKPSLGFVLHFHGGTLVVLGLWFLVATVVLVMVARRMTS